MLVNKKILKLWETELNDINRTCYASEEQLNKIFDNDILDIILKDKNSNKNNISYHTAKSPVSLRYINDALVWSKVLKYIKFDGKEVAELCPGNSIVIDLTLGLYNYKDTLYKVDFNKWSENKKRPIKRGFVIKAKTIDVIKKTREVPKSDLIILNHSIDDLFMGLWSEDNGVDYFGRAINIFKENDKFWKKAIANNKKQIGVLMKFAKDLAGRIKKGGYIIIKNYPSGFETNYFQIDRINFTYELTLKVADKIIKEGFSLKKIDLNKIKGPKGSKFNNSFIILKQK